MITLDDIITSCVNAIAEIPYNQQVFGRAIVFQEQWNEGIVTIPKVQIDTEEYVVPLPDDNLMVIAFFQAAGRESYGEFARDELGQIRRSVALTWWGNLCYTQERSLEQIKFDHITALQKVPYVSNFIEYVDERYQNVFPDFQSYIRANEQSTQWLMAPNSGFRLTFEVSYSQSGEDCL